MNFYIKAFLIFFRIGLFTIGGGYAMVPLIEADLVDKRKWVKKEDFLDLMALAQTVPGIFAFLDGTWHCTPFLPDYSGHSFVFQAIPTCGSCGTCIQGHPSCGSGLDCGSYLQNGEIRPHQPIQHLDSCRLCAADMAHRFFSYLCHYPQRTGRLPVRTLPKEI